MSFSSIKIDNFYPLSSLSDINTANESCNSSLKLGSIAIELYWGSCH